MDGLEKLDFQAAFGAVNFKTQPKSDDAVLVVIEFERGGTKDEMKDFEASIQPVIDNGIEGFELMGEEKFKLNKRTGVKEPYNDEIGVGVHFAFEKCTAELLENGWSSLKLKFARFWPIAELEDIPQQLLKFRGQRCDVALRYMVKQGELPLTFGDARPVKTTVTVNTPDGESFSASLEDMAQTLRDEKARRAASNLANMAAEDGATGTVAADRDPLFNQAVSFLVGYGTASTSALQRKFEIGYNRASGIMDALEAAGLIGSASGPNKGRDLLPAASAYVERLGERAVQ